MTGCCATAISYEGAKQLLKATAQFGRPVDCDLQHIWETHVNGFSLIAIPCFAKYRHTERYCKLRY